MSHSFMHAGFAMFPIGSVVCHSNDEYDVGLGDVGTTLELVSRPQAVDVSRQTRKETSRIFLLQAVPQRRRLNEKRKDQHYRTSNAAKGNFTQPPAHHMLRVQRIGSSRTLSQPQP
jgi:hypothetical protein